MFHSSRTLAILTDFGTSSPYVGVMKGVILSIHSDAKIIDLCHDVPPRDIVTASFLLETSYRFFPPGTVFASVIDPGVGSDRKIVCVRTADYYFLAPDNGILSFLEEQEKIEDARTVSNPKLYLHPVSRTFHGRDIFAPVAAHLSMGLDPAEHWDPIEKLKPRDLPRVSVRGEGGLVGEVLFIDRFGNLITNIPGDLIAEPAAARIFIKRRTLEGIQDHYESCEEGELMAIIGSTGMLEIAVSCGSAADFLRCGRGNPVYVNIDPTDKLHHSEES